MSIILEFYWIQPCFHPIAKGYTAKKYLKKIESSSCCKMHITGSTNKEKLDHEYLVILNRRGLTISSPNLVNYVCDAFTVLNAT